MKICSRCKERKELNYFGKACGSKTGLRSECKSCVNKYQANRVTTIEGRLSKILTSSKVSAVGSRAKRLGRVLEFDLDLNFLLNLWKEQAGLCAISGEKMFLNTTRLNHGTSNSPSLDRIDSSKGYIKDNVWLTCWWANNMKSSSTMKEFKTFVDILYQRFNKNKGGNK